MKTRYTRRLEHRVAHLERENANLRGELDEFRRGRDRATVLSMRAVAAANAERDRSVELAALLQDRLQRARAVELDNEITIRGLGETVACLEKLREQEPAA